MNPINNLRMILSDKRMHLKETLMNIQEFDVVAENFKNEIEVRANIFEKLGDLSVDWTDLKKQISELKV